MIKKHLASLGLNEIKQLKMTTQNQLKPTMKKLLIFNY